MRAALREGAERTHGFGLGGRGGDADRGREARSRSGAVCVCARAVCESWWICVPCRPDNETSDPGRRPLGRVHSASVMRLVMAKRRAMSHMRERAELRLGSVQYT